MARMLIAIFATTLFYVVRAEEPPVITPDSSEMALDEVGLYDVGYAYRKKDEVHLPIGWSGRFEARSGVCCDPVGKQDGRSAMLLHCPWKGGTGVAFQRFRFALPNVERITLRGATAMQAQGTEKSDGATFRVFVEGKKLLDVHRTDHVWKDFEFDLTEFAGKTVAIRFETDPGPKDDPSFDFSLWGGRVLVLKGFEPKAVKFPTPPALDLTKLASTESGTIAPPNAFDGAVEVRQRGSSAILRYSGADGTFEYRWGLPLNDRDPLFGTMTLGVAAPGERGVDIPLARQAAVDWTEPATLQDGIFVPGKDNVACICTYKVGEKNVTLRATGHLNGKSLVVDYDCDQPVIKKLNVGGFGPVLWRQRIPVPYYSGRVEFLRSENVFVNAMLDWTASSASSIDSCEAHYGALIDGSRRPLQERAVFAPAWHFDEVLPNIPNQRSPNLKLVGDKIILDTWGGRFSDIAANLETLHDYGITQCIVIVHDWQHSGYDNGLPTHFPANDKLGGEEDMKKLTATAKKLGYRIALHENYVDYYPNCDGFDEKNIALDSGGQRIKAWFNEGTKIQSFAVRPSSMLILAHSQSYEIHKRYDTSAMFIDVNSAVAPWFHVDFRAEEETGMLRYTWETHKKVWKYERQTHEGPAFGEGGEHWYWSGCLDGVEAELRAGWGNGRGESVPLNVDFDLLKIHPLQCNHGMGYFERWRESGESVPLITQRDQYRMQEALFGHAGFLNNDQIKHVPFAWLEHHLQTPVMERYTQAKTVKIEYEVNGTWADSTTAAKANQWNRVRVTYDNGLTVTANNSEAALKAGEFTLPRFGWLAEGAGVTAGTIQRENLVCDFAETDSSVFVNARNMAHWTASDSKRVRSSVKDFVAESPEQIKFSYDWRVGETIDKDYQCFVHFDAASKIAFQQDHKLATPTSQWKIGTTSDGPHTLKLAGVKDGDYEWWIGLWSQDGRLALDGAAGDGRVLLGTLHVRSGSKPTFDAAPDTGEESRKLLRQRRNIDGKTIDFGAIRTNGSVLLRREGNDWVLWAMPRTQSFQLELKASRFALPANVSCEGGDAPTLAPIVQGEWWRLPLNGAKQYRWRAK